MATSTTRRPLPALAFLLALSVLTVIVWWRVLHRDDTSDAATTSPTTGAPAPTCATTGARLVLPKATAVTVKVLNGNGATGLAATVATELTARGFPTGGTADATLFAGVADIEYGAKGKAGATLLSFYLPGSKLVAISRSDASVDLVLGQTYKNLATPAAVAASVARAAKPCSR